MRLFALALFLSTYILATTALSCLDRQNNEVPWFTFIKFPGNVSNQTLQYAYLDSNLGSSNYHIIINAHCDTPGEALPNTIEAINDLSRDHLNLLVYNDQPPGQDWDPYGAHAKGFLAYDNSTNTGVYVMHSFPKFPSVGDDGYINSTLPNNTITYGQNSYCISLNETNLHTILDHLPVEWPHVYYTSGFFNDMVFHSEIGEAATHFNLINGEDQWIFTKNPNNTGYLYESIISPYFDLSLAVESWGRPYQDPICPKNGSPAILNIDQIAFSPNSTWDHYSDHSKWAMSIGGTQGENVACMCDMNRDDDQQTRGGSCICSKNPQFYNALNSIVVATDKCAREEIVIVESI